MSITSTLIDGADIRFREAADVLRPYVGCFWAITAQRGAAIRVVPDGSTAISIRIENGRASGWFLRGPSRRFLIDRIGDARVPDVVSRAVQEIEREHGSLRVSELAERCGVSTRHLNRLMRAWVGYGAKCFARIVRFQTTLHQIERSPARAGAALASDTGYFDQAHLTQDVTRLAGATPRHLASHSVSDFSKTRCDDLP